MNLLEERGLIFTPRGRDAQVVAEVLRAQRFAAHICPGSGELITGLSHGAGFVIISEEALAHIAHDALAQWIRSQPAWSDLPFILFANKQAGSRSTAALQTLGTLANLVLLERPVNAQTVGAAVGSALRARRRQYQARGQLREIEETERHLRLALRAGRLGSWELNIETGVFSTSDLCRACFGYAATDEFTYHDLLGALHPDDQGSHHDAVEKAIEQRGDFDLEVRVFWPDGTPHWVQMRGQSIPGMGSARLAGVCTDITGRRNAETELRASRAAVEELNDTLEARIRERTSELAHANDRLMREIGERERTQSALVQAQKMEAIGQLTGGIAHDFNNLLHVISMNLQLIGRFTTDERIARLIEPARRAADRGAKLTGQLLTFARSQTLNLQPVDVNALIRNMGDLLKMSIGQQIPCEFGIGSGELVALADANQLEMAILNLAINARDAMPGGGVISISTAQHDSGPEQAEGGPCVVVSVSDTGSGIAPDIMAKVFDPFFTTKPSGKGTGLGLSQVYGFARQCGGAVKIRSHVGVGTAVEIWLPVSVRSAPRVPVAVPHEEQGGAAAKVLVVEDNPDVRQVIAGSLQMLGYTVTQARDGRAGLDALEVEVPELLIVDYAMPDMTGADVLTEVQARWPDLPVILATGYADMRTVEALIGPDAILRKPFDINGLSEAVQTALARRRSYTAS